MRSKLYLSHEGTAILHDTSADLLNSIFKWNSVNHFVKQSEASFTFPIISEEYKSKPYANMFENLDLRALPKMVIAHLNLLRNKFVALQKQIQDNVDIPMMSETKLDD